MEGSGPICQSKQVYSTNSQDLDLIFDVFFNVFHLEEGVTRRLHRPYRLQHVDLDSQPSGTVSVVTIYGCQPEAILRINIYVYVYIWQRLR